MRFFFLFFLIIGGVSAEELPGFKVLRQEEDYGSLRGKPRESLPEKMKFIPVGEAGYLSLGGELRERYEYYSNFAWGASLNEGDAYYLHRIMAHADLHLSETFRTFLQLKSGTVSDRELPPREIDKDELDLHQAFVDVKKKEFLLRLGRQELSYGSGRIISVREGPNVRQSFEGAKARYENGNFWADLISSRPVETDPWSFDDGADQRRELHGLYLNFSKRIEAYYFLLEREKAEYSRGTGEEERHSVGVRFFSPDGSDLDYDVEGLTQFGRFDNSAIRAWTVASNTGYTFRKLPLSPRLGLKANVASGDHNRGDGTLGTFNALFPRGAYFNEAAIIGPANIMDLHPSLEVTPSEGLTFSVDWDFLWRQSVNDGIYNLPLDPITSPDSSSREIGSQLAWTVEWQVNRHFFFIAQYMHFYAGEYLSDVTPGKDMDFFTFWTSFKF